MDENFGRRDFAKWTSAAFGGLWAGSLLGGRGSGGENRDKSDNPLVLLGLNALARAHQSDYFADGHRGASMIAAHCLCIENNLDEQARTRIAKLFDLNWASSALCKSFPDANPDPAAIAKIGAALIEGGQVLRQVGHNAIFATLAIKGFQLLPSAATPERIDGICSLIRSFKPWHDVEPDPNVNPPRFEDAKAASQFILREASEAIDRFVGFGQGFAGHMLTFGQSLVEMSVMAHGQWAESCRAAFCKYVTLTRRGPDPDSKRYPDRTPSDLRPTDSAYWEKRGDHSVDIGHVFKYPYSYYNLLRHADDQQLRRELDAKAYRLF